MAARSVSLVAMFNWIAEAFRLFASRFVTFFVAGLITLCVGLVASAPILVISVGNMIDTYKALSTGGAPPAAPMQNMPLFWAMYAVTLVLSLVVMPPLLVGWMRLYRQADLGAPTSPLDVLRPFADLATWARGIGYLLIAMVISLVVMVLFGVVLGVLGGGFLSAAMHAGGQSLPSAAPSAAMIALMFLVFLPAVLILQFLFMVGFAELALRDTSPLNALGLAAAATLKNLPGLVLLVFALMVLLVIGAIGYAIVVGIGVFVLMLVSKVLGGLAYLAAVLLLDAIVYALLFGGVYAAWKSVLGDEGQASGNDAVSA